MRPEDNSAAAPKGVNGGVESPLTGSAKAAAAGLLPCHNGHGPAAGGGVRFCWVSRGSRGRRVVLLGLLLLPTVAVGMYLGWWRRYRPPSRAQDVYALPLPPHLFSMEHHIHVLVTVEDNNGTLAVNSLLRQAYSKFTVYIAAEEEEGGRRGASAALATTGAESASSASTAALMQTV
jgi:hypothetical protein